MMDTSRLNFHHLRYFWAVAEDGSLTRTAKRLRVAQSALSAQIRQLESDLGQELFLREGRSLRLTEAGQITFRYAESIFSTAKELLATLGEGRSGQQELRIGAVATLSRNFQESFVRPLLHMPHVRLRFVSGTFDDLLGRLERHALDLVLANRPVQHQPERPFRCRHVARQGVSFVGHDEHRDFQFPRDAALVPMLLPGPDNAIRMSFDAICDKLDIRIHILAEVDDMAMLRLLARDTHAVTLVPPVVVRDELRSRLLVEHCVVPGLYEDFYAITIERQFAHPLVRALLDRPVDEMLGDNPS